MGRQLSKRKFLYVFLAFLGLFACLSVRTWGAGGLKLLPSTSTGTTANKELQISSYNWSDQSAFPTKVRDGLVLFVGLDTNGKAIPTTDGEAEIAAYNKAWVPTVNSFDYAFAVMSDKAVEAEDGTNYRYSWYSPATRQLRYASGTNNELNSLIISTSVSKQSSSGVYKTQLTSLYSGDTGSLENLKNNWRSLVTTAKQTESQRLWRYIAGTDGAGASTRVRDYLKLTQHMKDNINKQGEWTDDERNQGFLSYLDLLMTCYSSVDSDNAKVYWGNYIDRYISEGVTSGESTPFNLTLFSGTTMVLPENSAIGAEKMVAVLGCSDLYNYAYQVQSIGDFSDREIANNLTAGVGDVYGVDGFSKVLERIASTATGELNREPYEYPVTFKPVYEVLNNAYQGRYNIATGLFKPTGGTLAGRIHYTPYVTAGLEVYGADYIYALPQSLNKSSTSTLTGNFSVKWADDDSSYKALDSSSSNIRDSVQFSVRFKPITGEAGAWKNIANTYSEFRLVLMPERTFDKRTNVKTDGSTKTNGSNKEKYTPTAVDKKITVKLSKEEFQALVLGQMDYKGLYDISQLNQSLQMGQMITLGYDLKAEFQWFSNGVQKGSVEVPLTGYTQISASNATEREQNAQTSTYIVTVYREEEHASDLIYYTEPTAYAEIKQGTVEMDGNGSIEDYEAMSGVPSTEYLYYASGGSEFILEFELEYIEGERGLRKYETKFYGTECEFKHNDQFKDIKAQGKADENGKTDNPTILKDKFVADEKGFDYENPIEVEDEVYNGYVPTGAASYSVDLVGHKLDPNGLDPIGNIQSNDSQPITASWTGTIANETAQPGIVNIQNNNGKIPESGPGYPGDKGPETPKWNMDNYDRALKQALNWATAYEKTNDTFTVMKWADSDNFQRVWKIGNAVLTIRIDGDNPSGAGTVSRSYSGGNYTTANVLGSAQGSTIHGQMGTGWNFIMGNGASGSCSTTGDPPVHVHGSLSGHKDSTVTKIGNKSYTITVTFPTSSNGTNKLTAHELCGTCCAHNMRAVGDAWVQYSQYDYVQFKAVRVYKIHRSYVDGMEDITFADYGAENSDEALNHLMASGPLESYTTFKGKNGSGDPWIATWKDARKVITAKQQGEKHNGTDTIVGAITQGDPNIFYNIALMDNESDSVVNKSYALEVRQQMLDRQGKTVPSKSLSEYPSGSGILRSTRNVWAGRVRYTYLPQLMDSVWMAEYSQRGDATNLYAAPGQNDYNGLASFKTEGFGSRSNKCDGVGFYSSNGSMECKTQGANNPVKTVGNGHKKPTVTLKDPKLIFNRGSGGLSPSGYTADIPNFSNGVLYSAYDINNGSYKYTDDEYWMQTVTRPDDRTCATMAIDGTVETAGQYNNQDNGVVKSNYTTNTVDYIDYRTEEYYRFRFRRNETNKLFVVSDMLVLQTSTGDQPVMYHWKSQTKRNQQHYDYISADVDPKMASVDSKFTGTSITLKDNFKDAWYNQRAGDKNKTQDYYTATAVGWGVNNIGQDGAVNVGGYTGDYRDPDNKYSDTGLDLVTFNWADSWDGNTNEYQTRNTAGFETLFDHTGDTTDTSGTDVFAGYTRFYVDGFGWGNSYSSYLKGPAYLNYNGGSGGFYGCSAGNNKNYQAKVNGSHGQASSYNGGALGRWHWGSIIDSTSRDVYKSSPNVRLDAAYHSPGSSNNRSGESRMSNVAGLRIVTDMIEQDPTNPNKEYETGNAYQTYINILDYPAQDNGELLDGNGKPHTVTSGFNRDEFANTKSSGLASNMAKQKYFDRQVDAVDQDTSKTVKGLRISANYSDSHTKVNNIVVQNPISVQNALIAHNETAEKNGWYTDTRTTDITTYTAESLEKKKAELEVCPEDETCEFKVLDCQYFNDEIMLSLDFNKGNTVLDANGKGTVKNLAFKDGDSEKLEWVGLGDYKVVDKIITKTAVKDDPNTPEREDLTETGEQRYVVNEVQPFGASNGAFLEAVTDGKNGTRMSIPLSKLGIAEDNYKDHKLSVEFDLYMDTPYNADGTARSQAMLLGFNGYGFYIPTVADGGVQKLSYTTGNGVERYTTKFSPYGKASHLRFEFSFEADGMKKTRLYYNGKEITGFSIENNSAELTKDLIFGNSTGYLNIGCWTKDNNYTSRFYIDNFKVTKRAGVAEHNEDCYVQEKVFESSTTYLCTTPRIWETTTSASTAKPYIFTVPQDGKYKLQTWGASGGGDTNQTKGSHAGLGGYASGYISLKKGEQLMVYPGGKGEVNTVNPYEYLWVIDATCGAAESSITAASGTGEVVNIGTLGYSIKYVNSVNGTISTPYGTGIWLATNPNANACVNHSFSVAMYADGAQAGQMVKRVNRSLMGYKTQSFNYTGGMQTFTAPVAGTYTLKTWGASGGGNDPLYESGKGLGGYAQGTVTLSAGQKINVFVGGQGSYSSAMGTGGGYNGGGHGGPGGFGGGGMTHISTTNNQATVQFTNGTSASGTAEFGYSGNIQTWTVPADGNYTLEVYGAQGGGWGTHGNTPGGYSYGQKYLTKGTVLYIGIGGKGKDTGYSGGTGYNGGGASRGGTHTGGGATHIATANGVLSSLSGNRGSVLIVAGGGASNGFWGSNGAGGGLKGGDSADRNGNWYQTGASQTGSGTQGNKGGFGYGGSGSGSYSGAGGGGWFGGSGWNGTSSSNSDPGGGGGSAYIDGLSNAGTVASARAGDGYAKITYNINTYTSGGSWSASGTLIAAGGGGGADNTGYANSVKGGNDDGSGGHGGGTTGGNAYINGVAQGGTGGTHSSGYKQGVGESATTVTDTGGAGGGWWGGRATNNNNGGAGGGSGYIGGVANGSMQNGVQNGNGYAQITWKEPSSANTFAGAGFNGGGSAGVNGSGGGGATDIRRLTVGGKYVTQGISTALETTVYNGTTYVKVFEHNVNKGGWFGSEAELFDCNTPGKFSVLSKLDRYKVVGKYQFMLYYPEMNKRNVWRQTKQPYSEFLPDANGGTVTGYEPIEIQMADNYWGGLAKSTATDYTYIDGSIAHSNWWYSIGSKTQYNGNFMPGGNSTSVTQVQLWLACDKAVVDADNKALGGVDTTAQAKMSESGTITYGPYITAQPGWYQADIYGTALSDCTFDVYSNRSGVMYSDSQLLNKKLSPTHVSFYFYLGDKYDIGNSGLEVRTNHSSVQTGYAFDSLYLSRLDDRVIVAGGGGGADDISLENLGAPNDGSGGYGGGLIAGKATVNGKLVVAGQALTINGVEAGSSLQATINSIKGSYGQWNAIGGVNFSGCGLGGGQDYGFAPGYGEDVSYPTDTGGAGGGYYGGYVTNHFNGGAGGGSNYLSKSLDSTHQEGNNNLGHGRAMIQLIEHESSSGLTQLFSFSANSNGAHSGMTKVAGKVQTYTIPETGEYQLEVWGASGGDTRLVNTDTMVKDRGGKGGYTSAYVTLEKGTVLYVYVGGQGNNNAPNTPGSYGAGGWNGGGNGGSNNYANSETYPESGAGGGGMTHISLSGADNLDSNVLNRNNVLVIAGGGGGAATSQSQTTTTVTPVYSRGGEAGGEWAFSYSDYSLPGTQSASSGSGQAKGADGFCETVQASNKDGSGGGGSGWYGGGRRSTTPPTDAEGGAGGSGYINTGFKSTVTGTDGVVKNFPIVAGLSLSGRDSQPVPTAVLTANVGTQLGNTGNGYARITKVERGHSADCPTEVTEGEKPANVHIHDTNCLLAPSTAYYYSNTQAEAVTSTSAGSNGKLEGAIRQYVAGDQTALKALLGNTVVSKVGSSLAGYVNSNNLSGAVSLIAKYISEIPEDSEVFMCNNYPLNSFDEAKAKFTIQNILRCKEPHHTGGHYLTKKQAVEATGNIDATSCYVPCLDDEKHKKTPSGAKVGAQTVKGATFINTDEYFDLYFPTTGDFYESNDHGIGATQKTKGKGYTNNMDAKDWIRERYVKFDFDVLFYRTETGLWEQYSANEWIELPVKNGHDNGVVQNYPGDQYGVGSRTVKTQNGTTVSTEKEDWYSFYCTLNNNEKGSAKVTFEAEAINAPGSKGKYYVRDKYPIYGMGTQTSKSESFFRYTASSNFPGQVFGNDYTLRRQYDADDSGTGNWIDFPFMVWEQNASGTWLPNTSGNRSKYGFIGGGTTYLTIEQNRYNRVLGSNKTSSSDDNPATNHRNNNDNSEKYTNADRKSSLVSLHGAHLVRQTDLVGRVGNLFVTGTTDVRFLNFFKRAKTDGNYLINGIVKEVDKGVQRNYFSWHYNGVAGNRESLARDVRNRFVGKTESTDAGFNWLYDTWKSQYWKSARGGNEGKYEPENGAKVDSGTPATEVVKTGGSGKTMEYGPLALPISSDKNNLKVYRDKEVLKPGYLINYELTTIGNYTNRLQVKPYYYALSLSNSNDYPIGTIIPVDVYMEADGEYKPINLWGYEDVDSNGKQRFPATGISVFDYTLSLDWTNEQEERMITQRENDLTSLVHNTIFESSNVSDTGVEMSGSAQQNDEGYYYSAVRIPAGDFFKLGTAQLQRVENRARTFIGQNLTSYEKFVYDAGKTSNTDSVDLSDTNFEDKFDLADYAYRAQRWHLKIGLPSSSVFTFYDRGGARIKPTDEVIAKTGGDSLSWEVAKDTDSTNAQRVQAMNVIKNGKYAILVTANIRALGPVWNLYYSQHENNGKAMLNGSQYEFNTDFTEFTEPAGSTDKSNSQVLLGIYNANNTSTEDVDITGTH